jgi:hypothetical protein
MCLMTDHNVGDHARQSAMRVVGVRALVSLLEGVMATMRLFA